MKKSEIQGTSSMGYRERRSHARSVYPTQDTSRIGTVMVKQEEDNRVRSQEERNVGMKAKIPER